MKRLIFACAALAVMAPHAAAAQSPDEVILYSSTQYRGAKYKLSGATRPIEPPFRAKSVQMPEGKSWEFCTGQTFTGCRQITGSDPSVLMNVRSARPVAPVLTDAQPGAATPGLAGSHPSLRGISSEFFVAPDQSGMRIEVVEGTAEAMTRRAVEFCQSRGWRSSPYARLQKVSERFYLADVLCSDTSD